jgi:hypothetical protein
VIGLFNILRVQRYAGRPSLAKIFEEVKTKTHRDKGIYIAHVKYEYSLKEMIDDLKIHYTTVSEVIKEELANEAKIMIFQDLPPFSALNRRVE